MNPTLTKAAANLKRRAANRGRDLPSLWILSDEKRLPDPRAALVSMPRGSALILRHYGAQGREALARRLAQLCRQKGVASVMAKYERCQNLCGPETAENSQQSHDASCSSPASGIQNWN
jgi:hypothetical protein